MINRPTSNPSSLSIIPRSVLALDLEGTLISNAMSQIPRPHLYSFLSNCNLIFSRIVIFTAISKERFDKISTLLVKEGTAPNWFKDIEYIYWTGKYKDLNFISNSSINNIILIDDRVEYVEPTQMDRWLHIPEFSPPYLYTDNELDLLWKKLLARYNTS